MFREQPDEKREFIRTHIYKLDGEISPTLLFQITAKDSHRYQNEGWREVLVSIQHQGEKWYMRYTGINAGGIRYATQKRDSETKQTQEVHPILKVFGQAFKVFRKGPS
jgi:hypothetical protein